MGICSKTHYFGCSYCAVLKVWRRDNAPLYWATAQNNLCWALLNLADIEHDGNELKHLSLAICSCLSALEEWHPDRPGANWPNAQDNLGVAFTKRGELENDTATLKQAVEAHRSAHRLNGQRPASQKTGPPPSTTLARH